MIENLEILPKQIKFSVSGLFVDVIHTDATFFGAPDPSGTADFWPNAGRDQPNCPGANWNIYNEESTLLKFCFKVVRGTTLKLENLKFRFPINYS